MGDALSTSARVRVIVALLVPGMALAVPPASTSSSDWAPAVSVGPSLVPVMAKFARAVRVVMPSQTATRKESVAAWPWVNAWVSASLLLRV